MTDEEINTTIAELSDFGPYCKECSAGLIENYDGEGNYSSTESCQCGGLPLAVPNYVVDLNAMHEAEMSFPMSNCDFVFALARIVGADMSERSYVDISKIAQATARQRAEALLKARGRWE